MIRHWLRLRERGWRLSLAINGFGAVATGVVVLIVGATKFTEGTWISLLAMLGLLTTFILIRRHYDWFYSRLGVDERCAGRSRMPPAVPLEFGTTREQIIVPVDDISKATLSAIDVAREISPRVTAVHVHQDRFGALAPL